MDSLYLKHRDADVLTLINRKMLIHKQLQHPARTYVVYSDLHGSYDKFIHWLKNGLGYYRIAIKENLGDAYSNDILEIYEGLLFLVNRTRIEELEKFIEGETESFDHSSFYFFPVNKKFLTYLDRLKKLGLSNKRIIEDILIVLRGITRGDERRIVKVVPKEHLENILKLYIKNDQKSYNALIDGITANDEVFPVVASLLIKVTLANMFDKHINLGDTYDRGEGADKLVKLYRTFFDDASPYAHLLHYIWGNHDIVWLGAACGNPILAMTALRISMRYNNVDFLSRYGFNLEKLRAFSDKCYNEIPTGSYTKAHDFSKFSLDEAAKMTKVLFVLESKLTVALLKDLKDVKVSYTDFGQDLIHHQSLLNLFPTGIEEDKNEWERHKAKNPLFLDSYFPTIDPNNPEALTPEEGEVVNDLLHQFLNLPKLQEDIKWLLKVGETYRVVDRTLYFHAAMPSTEDKNLAVVGGKSGKALLDFVHEKIKSIGVKHAQGEEISLEEKMYFWHLWSGAESPFFCKSKMATVERTIFDREIAAKDTLTTHSERPNPFYKNIRDDHFLHQLLKEFQADKICMGHTPVKTLQHTILSQNIGAFCVDGGASSAYGDRGAVLINTPEYNYLTFQPPLAEIIAAEKIDKMPEIEIITLEEKKNLRLSDMDKGMDLKKELQIIEELLKMRMSTFQAGYFL
jgi:fructose-1,6-bisphosphatase III